MSETGIQWIAEVHAREVRTEKLARVFFGPYTSRARALQAAQDWHRTERYRIHKLMVPLALAVLGANGREQRERRMPRV